MCGKEKDEKGSANARSSVSVGILMVWTGAAKGKVEFEYAKSGPASSRKEKASSLGKFRVSAGAYVCGRSAPGIAGICGDALLEEIVAGKERSCSSVGRVVVGGEGSPTEFAGCPTVPAGRVAGTAASVSGRAVKNSLAKRVRISGSGTPAGSAAEPSAEA